MKVRNKTNRKPKSSKSPKSSRSRNRRLAAKRANGLDFQSLEDRRLLATLTVSSLGDAGTGSLREVITMANSTTEVDTILFSVGGTINLESQLPTITEAVTIDGDGQITLDAGNGDDGVFGNGDGFRIFNIRDNVIADLLDVTLSGLTLTGGDAANSEFGGLQGGAISSQENLTVIDSTITGNSAGDGLRGIFGNGQGGFEGTDGGNGGGIFSAFGTLSIINSTVSGNQSGNGGNGDAGTNTGTVNGGVGGSGGGIYSSGPLTIDRSTISGNTAGTGGADGNGNGSISFADGGRGGGIHTTSGLTIVGSTISGNETQGSFAHGGGIAAEANATIVNSTVTDNQTSSATSNVDGIWNDNEVTLIISNSIVAENNGSDLRLSQSPQFPLLVNYSLIQQTGLPLNGVGNIEGVSPNVGPLTDNGGPTQTHALLENSPAIDAGNPSITFDANEFDQRGEPFVRVFDDPTASGNRIDIGAFERQTFAAAFFVVTTTQDELDFSNSAVSLREAIYIANGSPGSDTITFDSSVFSGGDNNVIRLTQGELVIGNTVSIDGSSVGGVVITGDANGDDITQSGTHITDVSASFGGIHGALDDLLDDNSRVLNFSGPTGELTLSDLTITGGRTTVDFENGGGIRFDSSGAINLNNSTLSGNSTTGGFAHGGGIYTRSGYVSLTNSTASGNSTTGNRARGGGISTFNSDVSLTDSTVSGNSAENDGGGIYAQQGSVSLTNSTVSGNSAGSEGGGIRALTRNVSLLNSTVSGNSGSSGGGIAVGNSSVSLINSTVSGNSALGRFGNGGGITTVAGSVSLTNSTVSGNSTAGDMAEGGGISTFTGNVSLINSTMSGNSSTTVGGGIYTRSGSVSLINSTLTGNSASGTGGGVFVSDTGLNATFTINNSIVAANFDSKTTGTAGTPNDLVPDPDSVLTINHSLIGVTDGLTITGGNNLTGTVAAPLDPLLGPLADNGGPTLTHALLADSQAIDAGDDALAVDASGIALTTDQRGGGSSTRIFDDLTATGSGVDIGAFERNTVVVDNQVDEDDGDFSAGDLSLREAIGLTNGNFGTITFDGSVFTGGYNSVIRLTQGELVIDKSVSIDGTSVGGVVITGDTDDDDVTLPGTHITDVSASFGGTAGVPSDLLDDNSRVLKFLGIGTNLSLTGLTITGGRDTTVFEGGGGILSDSSGTLTLSDSTVSGNSTTGGLAVGGGISAFGELFLVNSTVSGNRSGNSGGAIYGFSDISLVSSTLTANSSQSFGSGIGTRFSDVSLVNSTVSDNVSGGNGGGIRTTSGNVSLVNSTVSGNSSGVNGGGIRTSGGDVSLVNSTVSGNNSDGEGGGIRTSSGDVSLVNSTVTGNSASGAGGGVFVADSGLDAPLTINNSIVAGNFQNTTPGTTAGTPDDLVPNPGSVLTINHSLIGVTDGLTITGGNNLTGTVTAPLDPLLGPLVDNGGPTLTHALLPGSPAVNAGDNNLAVDENGNLLTTDQRGEDRFEFGTVDIGAVEGTFVLGDVNQNGFVDFSDIAPFIFQLSNNNFLGEADIDRNGVVDFRDIAPFINLLASSGQSNVTFESFSGAPPVSSAVSVVDVSEPESITSDASTVEEPITVETALTKTSAPKLAISQSIAATNLLPQASRDSGSDSLALPVDQAIRLPAADTTVTGVTQVDTYVGPKAINAIDPVPYGFLGARDSSFRGFQSNEPLVNRRAPTWNVERNELPRESRGKSSADNESTEDSLRTVDDLFDAEPESLDAFFTGLNEQD